MMPIIITTNRNTREIEEEYGAGIMSLFTEACRRVNVKGKDFRKEKSHEY